MLFLVDGSNVAGSVARAEREEGAKRELVRLTAQIVRAHSGRAILFFDGNPPGSFATRLGNVEVRFSGPQPADEQIAVEALRRKGVLAVVTNDRALLARVERRGVKAMSPREFLELVPPGEADQTLDWDAYFSDPNNRNI